MKDKVNRLEAIKSIVSANRVSGQEELLQRLREQGFDLTQATLSRDLCRPEVISISFPNWRDCRVVRKFHGVVPLLLPTGFFLSLFPEIWQL